MPIKQGVRILAIDDSSFSESDRQALAIGVIGRGDTVEGILSFRVAVDGSDATQKIVGKVRRSRFADQIRLIALNGVTLAGLNVVDIAKAGKALRVPIVSIVRRKPHSKELEKAIAKHGSGAGARLSLIRTLNSKFAIERAGGFYVQRAGISSADFKRLQPSAVKLLRLAHIIASGVSNGESKGRV